MSVELIALILAILFIAALTKATLGFGESLLAIPLLTMVIGIQVAAPLVSLMAAAVTLLIILKSWQGIDLSATWRLNLAALAGVPVGVWGLKLLPESWLATGLGILLILVGLYYLLQPTLGALHNTNWAYLAGFLAGALGGAYNMASPPVVVYGAMRGWSPEQFRVTLQGFFLPVSVMILIGHATAGLWTTQVLQLFAISIPVVLLAFWTGSWLNRTIATQHFAKIVYGGLVVIGVMLLL